MAYYIETPLNSNLEDTAIPNLFITDYLPDAPDGDFVKIYIYAYMCCRQGIALTHTELASRLGLMPEKVIAAWRYFSDRRIVRLVPQTPGDELHFDVEFVDVKGALFGGNGHTKVAGGGTARPLSDPALAALFQRIAVIQGAPSMDGSDMKRVISWIEDFGATPEIIEFAFSFCAEERGEKNINYVGKVVKEWAEKELKTVAAVREYRAGHDARSGIHKQLMEAFGLRYSVITASEEKLFNYWLDECGYTVSDILDRSEKAVGISNKLKYVAGIIRNETESKPKGDGSYGTRTAQKDRSDFYLRTRQENEAAAAARLEEVYAALPEAKEADEEKVRLNMEIAKTLASLMPDKQSALDRLNKEVEANRKRRTELLAAAGFAADYTEIHHTCPRCRDTGLLENGEVCPCYP